MIKHWTENEDRLLIELYQTLTHAEIGKKLGRTEKAIRHRMIRIRQDKIRYLSPWTREEDELLAELSRDHPSHVIAEILGLTLGTVRQRLRQLGLRYWKPNTWTTKEKKLVARLYATTPTEEIAERLGRTISSVQYSANELGVRKDSYHWTPALDAELRRLYARTPSRLIAEQLGRSIQGILCRARRLGLRKDENLWTPEEDAQIAELYPTMDTQALAKQMGRTRGAIIAHAAKLGIRKLTKPLGERSSSRAWTPEEKKEFLRLYPATPARELAAMLGRSVQAIEGYAAKFGIKREPPWTPEMDAELERCYARTPTRRIAEQLGRSVTAIRARARALRLRKDENSWTPAEDAQIAACYPEMDTRALAERLGRTPGAVVTRAQRLGIRKLRSWSVEDDALIIRQYHQSTRKKIGAALGKNEQAIQKRATRLGLRKLKPWSGKEMFLLFKLFPDTTAREISNFMGRPQRTVYHKLRTIHAPPNGQHPCPNPYKPWTKQDDAILRQLYPVVPNGDIAEFLGRSAQSVLRRAKKINLDQYESQPDALLKEYSFWFLLRLFAGIEQDAHLKHGDKTYLLQTVLQGRKKVWAPKEPGAMALALVRAREASLPERPLRVAFAGTPEFAARVLAAIVETEYDIPLVLTQPDRPGRGMKPTANAVKQFALQQGLRIDQPKRLRTPEQRAAFEASRPDVLVVVDYGLTLPPEMLALPRLGCLNLHASLLPRWRGEAPISRAIEAGDAETGVTLIRMDAGLDTGPICLRRTIPIAPDDTLGSLHDKLARLGAEVLVDALARLAAGDLPAEAQPDEGVTYASKVSLDDAELDWRRPAAELERQVRAFDPFPGAFGRIRGAVLRIWAAQTVAEHGEPGSLLRVDASGVTVACGEGALRITELQRPGRRRLPVAEFLPGFALTPGERFERRTPPKKD